MSLATTFLGVNFANPFMNAAGVMCQTENELTSLAQSSSGSLITKSCTSAFREGNPEPRYSKAPLGSINSMGLPNLGFDFYFNYAKNTFPSVNVSNKPIFFSISGLSLEESTSMAQSLCPLATEGQVILELNLSCPNVPGKPQIGYDMEDMDRYLNAVSSVYSMPFGVKMPPYFDFAHFDSAAAVLNKYDKVAFVTCINSVGNGLVIDIDSEQTLIRPKAGFGGIGGSYVLPTALANVNAFYTRCPGKKIIGCGGVTSGSEAFMHILAGASLVQIGTQLQEEGVGVFDRILSELRTLMEKKGYTTLSDFHGKLKTL
uniref:Dihydroorotate dehydrogenase (fumarate) n=1 Tax=Parabodo caudatus TaxID=351713 RepID=A9CQ08_9EUGL|nr:dihydroorotate dehydrogenase [Parabodo caudatus]